MPKQREDLFDTLIELPWWVSVVLAAIVYVALRFILPAINIKDRAVKELAKAISGYAWVAAIFLMPAGASAVFASRKRRLLDKQTGIESIRRLSWKRFEELLGEAFRRRGYSVVENARTGADGGIDLRLRRDGNVYLVQCKHWRTNKVGVKIVREMMGLVTAHRASGGIIVTSGFFTQEAQSFAAEAPIDLVEGQALVEMIRSVQKSFVAVSAAVGVSSSTNDRVATKACRSCGANLIVREARRGLRPGSKFWGCSRYPQCRYTESIDAP